MAKRAAGHEADAGPFELLRARYLIEAECAALAAKSAKKRAGARRSREALDEMQRGNAAAEHQPLSGDRDFHLRIAEATGNGALVAVVKMLWEERTGALYKQLEHHYDSPSLWESAMAEHRAVLKAIAAHDAKRRAFRDAAAPQPGVQAIFDGLGHVAVAAASGRVRRGCEANARNPLEESERASGGREAEQGKSPAEPDDLLVETNELMEEAPCLPVGSTPRKTCASSPSTCPRRDPARCCCGWAPPASAGRTSTTTSRAATATSSCASR